MSTAAPTGKVHKRAYQACIPCRERRVRCDLGSVDQPHQGPCGRCRRERKFCHFSATRGRKKGAPTPTPAPSGPNDHIAATTTQPWEESTLAAAGTPAPLSGGVSQPGESSASPIGIPPAIKREHSLQHVLAQDTPRPATRGDKTAEKLLRDAAYTSHDALNLLFEAGRHSERVARSDHSMPGGPSRLGPIPSRETRPSAAPSLADPAPDLHPWSNLRFVRTGLITAEEAFDLVNYFHTYLAPFTPIASSSFQDPSMHSELIEEEPILAMTILMLASRYMKLSGPGSVSRSYMVHERLWQHLQGMISRMIFGQEQFTGGTHTHDGPPEASNLSTHEYPLAGSSFGSLRTLGSCEALLLLSEWHPRSLHVPAGDDGDSIVVKDDVRRTRASTAGIGGRIRIDWLEPVWRSDRMCWSMLGNALALAVELGIFDEYDNTTIGARESRRDIWSNPLSSQRAHLVQHLLWVYLTQTSGRLGWKNLTSVSVSHHDTSTKHGDTIRCWVGVASLMKRGNELLFPSRERTREIVKTGEYLAVLRVLNPLLREWQKEFDRAKLSRQMRSILTIEFGYVRVYIHSVALQAVIEHYYHVMHEGGTMPEASLLEPFEGNREYFMEVIAAAKSILQTVVEDLLPDNHLKHVPIRTYSRVLAGAMFCLKATSLGAKDFETSGSLSLVERTADALCDTNNQMMVCGPGSYHELSMGRMGLGDHSIADPEYDICQAGSSSATAAGTPAYYAMHPASGSMDQTAALQNDPLINFAGLGPNQLGWSGGQDFFDMLGPLLDVQYEQYK
ncbi:uncharacterized protein GIQ15_00399 [Arthroderma uncinatum]|uniref:uncharacterized protein n=1 Tax=Arthroderma uncinatum TaxID=74035 RepID=UPI00144A59F3|nr:uncharacterized protein GIQ15_00399 [Arthroderma uncinatum]KAF3490882.1 hypothetical protein GIQ15_00399 [Arthroderma uncinatum]